MKRLIILIITLIILTNVSYAAFPITEDLYTETLQIPPVKFNDPIDTWTLILTIVWPVLFYVFHIPIYEWTICIKSLWFISSTCFSPIFILALISFIGSIILSRIALKRKKLKGGINSQHFTHWKAVLALLMLPLVIILELLLDQ